MAERTLIPFSEVDMAARDVQDVLLVVSLVLNAESTALTARSRDALATVVRLGQDRARVVHMGLDDLQEVRHA